MNQNLMTSAPPGLGPCVAALLPVGGRARLLCARDASVGARDAVLTLAHDRAQAVIPGAAFDETGLAADARPLLAETRAPLCAARRVEEGLEVLLAWGPRRHEVPLDAAFEALRPRTPSAFAFEDVFENAMLPMLVVGGDRRLHAANRAGRAILEEGKTLGCAGGRIAAPDPDSDTRLEAALSRAAAEGPITVPVAAADGGRGLRCGLGRIDRPVSQGPSEARFLLTASPIGDGPQVEAILMDRFGLTPAEARLAGHLAAGRDLHAAGARMGVSRHTARKYLQIAFSKMGVRRQADLVRLALRLSHASID